MSTKLVIETPEPAPVVETTTNVITVEVPETIEAPETVEAPVAVVPTPEPEVVYEYQPADDLGRPLGAKQVFKGKTHQEVLDKVAKAHQESIKLTRELKKNLRLGNIDIDEIPDEAVRYDDEVDFSPRTLSAEDRYRISKDILDPEKVNEATDILFESALGAKPNVIRETLKNTAQTVAELKAKSEAETFMRTTPDYYPCMENFETITNWMIKNNLKPLRSNFSLAYNQLKAVGLLLEAPIMREEVPAVQPVVEQSLVNTQPEPELVSRITDVEPPSHPKRPVVAATGLNRSNTSDVGAPVQSNKLTLADINKMPSAEYKRFISVPANQKLVEELIAKSNTRR